MAKTNMQAIALMTVSMLCFAITDGFIKLVSEEANAGQIMVLASIISSLIFIVLIFYNKDDFQFKIMLERPILIRTLGDVFGASCMVISLGLLPLGNASAILQFQPLVVTMGAALFLREKVGWRRWSAIIIGFIGVMIIIRPGLNGFNSASILVIFAVIGLATRDLATRVIRTNIANSSISLLDSLALIIAGFIISLFFDNSWLFPLEIYAHMALIGCFGGLGYFCITKAVRLGEISAIAPYRYSRLIFALILGFIFFGEIPDMAMMLGSAIIISAGIYTIYREKQ